MYSVSGQFAICTICGVASPLYLLRACVFPCGRFCFLVIFHACPGVFPGCWVFVSGQVLAPARSADGQVRYIYVEFLFCLYSCVSCCLPFMLAPALPRLFGLSVIRSVPRRRTICGRANTWYLLRTRVFVLVICFFLARRCFCLWPDFCCFCL